MRILALKSKLLGINISGIYEWHCQLIEISTIVDVWATNLRDLCMETSSYIG
jgi:hypothetical protein